MAVRRPRPFDRTTPDLELIAAAHDGDSDAFDLLVDRYRRFVRSRSRGYFLVGGDRDDLEQEALIGFYKAVRDFNPEMQASFRSFAELCMNRQLITAIKAATRKKHTPLNRSVSISAHSEDEPAEDHAFASLDPLDDPLERLVASEDLAATQDLIDTCLSPLEIQVVQRYMAGHSYEVIALDLGRHTKAVDNALQRVKRKLANHMAEATVAAT